MLADTVGLIIFSGAIGTAVGVLGRLAHQTFRAPMRERHMRRVRMEWATTYQMRPLPSTTSHRRVMVTAPGMAMW